MYYCINEERHEANIYKNSFKEVISILQYYAVKSKPKVEMIKSWQNKNEGLIKQKEVH